MWTAEMQETLVRMAAAGAHAGEAAKALGVTRNACIGRAFRTGVVFGGWASERAEQKAREAALRIQVASERAAQITSRAERSAERKQKARELYLQGATYAEISAATGYILSYINKVTEGLPRRRPHYCTDYDEITKIDAVVRMLTGTSLEKVARETGIPRGSIANWRYGVQVPGEGRKPSPIYAKAIPIAQAKNAERAEAHRLARVDKQEREQAHRAEIDAINAPIIPKLSPRLREVVEARLSGETLQSIGNRLGVTRERVRQLEARARARFGIHFYHEAPLSESILKVGGIKPLKRIPKATPARDMFRVAHRILAEEEGRRAPYRISEEDRERRRQRMRRVRLQQLATAAEPVS